LLRHKTTETHPDAALLPISDIRRQAQLVPDTALKLEFVGWLQDEFPVAALTGYTAS
jgi:hypothetical protein